MLKFIGNDLSRPPVRTAWVVGTVVLGVAGPFELSDTMGLWSRLIYWFAAIGVALVLAAVLRFMTPLSFPGGDNLRTEIFGLLVFTLCFTPVIYFMTLGFSPDVGANRAPWYEIGGVVLLAACSVSLIVRSVKRQYASEPVEKVSAADLIKSIPETEFLPLLYNRLRSDLQRGRILRLSMQDHYVEVHTDLGTQLLLMRMSDAIKELDGVDGMQVHRSHWVATAAVEGKTRENGRLLLVTKDGAKVPVSRSHNADVREAGLV